MSVDMTNEMKDLLELYSKGVDRFRSKEQNILPILVDCMLDFCEVYQKRVEIEEKFESLKEKLGITDEEGENE